MQREWIALPFLTALWIVETVIIRDITLFSGAADLLLIAVIAWALQSRSRISPWVWAALAGLLAEATSAMPAGAYLLLYAGSVGLVIWLRRQAFPGQFLLHVAVLLFASTLGYGFMFGMLWIFRGQQGDALVAINQIILPSLFLNLLWSFPLFYWLRDLAAWVYAEEEIVP